MLQVGEGGMRCHCLHFAAKPSLAIKCVPLLGASSLDKPLPLPNDVLHHGRMLYHHKDLHGSIARGRCSIRYTYSLVWVRMDSVYNDLQITYTYCRADSD